MHADVNIWSYQIRLWTNQVYVSWWTTCGVFSACNPRILWHQTQQFAGFNIYNLTCFGPAWLPTDQKKQKTLLLTLNSLASELGPCTKRRVCVRSIQVTLRQKVWFSPKCIKISVNIYFSKNLDIHHFQRVNVRKEKYYYRENVFTLSWKV